MDKKPGKISSSGGDDVQVHKERTCAITENILSVKTCSLSCQRGDLTVDWLKVEIYSAILFMKSI